MIITVYSGNIWNIIFLLLTIQFVGVLKGFMAGLMRRDMRMVYMSLYSSLYITSLLPAKIFAILTIRKKGWGTSGRKTMLTTYNALIPPLTWLAILLPGLVYTFYVHDYSQLNDDIWIGGGIAIYIGYWALTLFSYIFFVQPHLAKKSDFKKEGEDASDGSPASSDNSPSLQPNHTSNGSPTSSFDPKAISSKVTTTGFFGHSSDDSRSNADELYDISLDDIESQKSNMRDLSLDEESVQTLPPSYLQPMDLPIEQMPIQNEHKNKIIKQENTYKTIQEVFDSIMSVKGNATIVTKTRTAHQSLSPQSNFRKSRKEISNKKNSWSYVKHGKSREVSTRPPAYLKLYEISKKQQIDGRKRRREIEAMNHEKENNKFSFFLRPSSVEEKMRESEIRRDYLRTKLQTFQSRRYSMDMGSLNSMHRKLVDQKRRVEDRLDSQRETTRPMTN